MHTTLLTAYFKCVATVVATSMKSQYSAFWLRIMRAYLSLTEVSVEDVVGLWRPDDSADRSWRRSNSSR